MTQHVEFAFVAMGRLREHEETEPARVHEVRSDIERRGVVDEPILVARDSHVVLNGHHRFAALRELGARWVPVYLVDYTNGSVLLDRWGPGPPISKADVVRVADEGRLFPPKTTRHRLLFELPHRPTPLPELLKLTHPAERQDVSPTYRPPPPDERED